MADGKETKKVVNKETQSLEELKEQLRKFRFDNALGQLTDTSKIKKLKKKIALLLTKQNSRQHQEKPLS